MRRDREVWNPPNSFPSFSRVESSPISSGDDPRPLIKTSVQTGTSSLIVHVGTTSQVQTFELGPRNEAEMRMLRRGEFR